MSGPKTRAYAASAEALKLNVLAYGAELLGLDPAVERIVEDATEPYRVRIDTGLGASFPIMDVSLKEWRRRGPGSTTEVMVRGLSRLALTRVWRRHGTVAPPAGLLEVNAFGRALVERAGVEPQAFADAVWSPVQIGDKYTDTADWMSDGAPPSLLVRAPVATHPVTTVPAGLPWLSGYSGYDTIFVEAAALSDEVVVHWSPLHADRFELRLPAGMAMTTINAMPGAPLRRLLSHSVLNRFELVIRDAVVHRRTIRFTVLGAAPWRRIRFKGGNDVRRDLKDEIRALKPGRRLLEDLIARHLTLPGRKGDVEPDLDDIRFDDDFDEFTGRPWPERDEFPGIMERRRLRDAGHREEDPVIHFDEDDPAAYA